MSHQRFNEMNVAELIVKLQTMDQALPVYTSGTDGPVGYGLLKTEDVHVAMVPHLGDHGAYVSVPGVLIELE